MDDDGLHIGRGIAIPFDEIQIEAIRAQGAGGQNVNKVSSAIHLRFDIEASSLPASVKQALIRYPDNRITRDGIVVIKAQRFRRQEKNRRDALDRLRHLIQDATVVRKPRKATKPTASSRERRLKQKQQRSRLKQMRRPPAE